MPPKTRRPASTEKPPLRGRAIDTKGVGKADILKLCKDLQVGFLRLQFTDITGVNKNVEVPRSQFEKAVAGEVMFDGSSIDGFSRVQESDVLARPDAKRFERIADRLDEALAILSRLDVGGITVFPLFPHEGEPAIRVVVTARKGVKTPFKLLPGMVLHHADGGFTDAARAVLEGEAALPLWD